MEAKEESQFAIAKVDGKLCISDLSPGDVPLVGESWFADECTQLTSGFRGLEGEDALLQGLRGVVAPRSPSNTPTKASSVHGDSPIRSPRNPLTLASVRPAQSHVEAVVSPARGSVVLDEVSGYSGSNRDPTDDKMVGIAQVVNDGSGEGHAFPPGAPTSVHFPAVECVLGENGASRVSGDDMSAAASQYHLDTDRESISTTLRGDSFAEVGLGAQSSLVPEHVSGGAPASGSSSGGGKRQKQPKKDALPFKQTPKQNAAKKLVLSGQI